MFQMYVYIPDTIMPGVTLIMVEEDFQTLIIFDIHFPFLY